MRATAGIIAAIIFFVILAVLVFPLMSSWLSNANKSIASNNQLIYNAVAKMNKGIKIYYYPFNSTVEILNSGSNTERLQYLILSRGGSVFFLKFNQSIIPYGTSLSESYFDGSILVMPPSSSIQIYINDGSIVLGATTVDGVLITPSTQQSIYGGGNYYYGASTLYNPVYFFTSDLAKLISSGTIGINDLNLIATPTPQAVAAGFSGGAFRGDGTHWYPLVAVKTYQNVHIKALINITGSIINGFQPEWTTNRVGNPLYNMLISLISAYGGDSVNGLFTIMDSNGNILNLTSPKGSNNWGTSSNNNDAFTSTLINMLGRNSGFAWRMKIIGLNASTIAIKYYNYDPISSTFSYSWLNGTSSIGKFYYGGVYEAQQQSSNTPYLNVNIPQTFIQIEGDAQSIMFYDVDTSLPNKPSSYDPYFIVADTDGNSYAELIFLTEDLSFSYLKQPGQFPVLQSNNVAIGDTLDSPKGGSPLPPNKLGSGISAIDYTNESFVIILNQTTVKGSIFSVVEVIASLYYHDNIYDPNENDLITQLNNVIISVMLLDRDAGYKVVSSKNYTYQELSNLETTWPPSKATFSIDVPLMVPNNNDTYVVAVGFTDPYSIDISSNGANNLDFTLGIEFIGFKLYAR